MYSYFFIPLRTAIITAAIRDKSIVDPTRITYPISEICKYCAMKGLKRAKSIHHMIPIKMIYLSSVWYIKYIFE